MSAQPSAMGAQTPTYGCSDPHISCYGCSDLQIPSYGCSDPPHLWVLRPPNAQLWLLDPQLWVLDPQLWVLRPPDTHGGHSPAPGCIPLPPHHPDVPSVPLSPQVAMNGQHALEFLHRLPLTSVQALEVTGDVTLTCITFTGSVSTPRPPPPHRVGTSRAWGHPGGLGHLGASGTPGVWGHPEVRDIQGLGTSGGIGDSRRWGTSGRGTDLRGLGTSRELGTSGGIGDPRKLGTSMGLGTSMDGQRYPCQEGRLGEAGDPGGVGASGRGTHRDLLRGVWGGGGHSELGDIRGVRDLWGTWGLWEIGDIQGGLGTPGG